MVWLQELERILAVLLLNIVGGIIVAYITGHISGDSVTRLIIALALVGIPLILLWVYHRCFHGSTRTSDWIAKWGSLGSFRKVTILFLSVTVFVASFWLSGSYFLSEGLSIPSPLRLAQGPPIPSPLRPNELRILVPREEDGLRLKPPYAGQDFRITVEVSPSLVRERVRVYVLSGEIKPSSPKWHLGPQVYVENDGRGSVRSGVYHSKEVGDKLVILAVATQKPIVEPYFTDLSSYKPVAVSEPVRVEVKSVGWRDQIGLVVK